MLQDKQDLRDTSFNVICDPEDCFQYDLQSDQYIKHQHKTYSNFKRRDPIEVAKEEKKCDEIDNHEEPNLDA